MMKITALVENTTCNNSLTAEHGLSLLIEYSGSRILFDTGATDAFVRNAEKLGVDLSSVDFAVLSHGHFDHAGGLIDFFRLNQTAPVNMKQEASDAYYASIAGIIKRYVGVNPSVFTDYSGRLRFLGSDAEPVPGLHILTDIVQIPEYQVKSRFLRVRREGKTVIDDFRHELVLAAEESDGIVAITGCSHNGIIGLLETVKRRFPGKPIKTAVGGFHLIGMSPDSLGCSEKFIESLADKLMEYGAFYTCHCTGGKAFDLLKRRMGDRLQPLRTGMTVTL